MNASLHQEEEPTSLYLQDANNFYVPHGGLGFANTILTIHVLALLASARSPLFPWQKLRYPLIASAGCAVWGIVSIAIGCISIARLSSRELRLIVAGEAIFQLMSCVVLAVFLFRVDRHSNESSWKRLRIWYSQLRCRRVRSLSARQEIENLIQFHIDNGLQEGGRMPGYALGAGTTDHVYGEEHERQPLHGGNVSQDGDSIHIHGNRRSNRNVPSKRQLNTTLPTIIITSESDIDSALNDARRLGLTSPVSPISATSPTSPTSPLCPSPPISPISPTTPSSPPFPSFIPITIRHNIDRTSHSYIPTTTSPPPNHHHQPSNPIPIPTTTPNPLSITLTTAHILLAALPLLLSLTLLLLPTISLALTIYPTNSRATLATTILTALGGITVATLGITTGRWRSENSDRRVSDTVSDEDLAAV
ncbi:hypothetical protein B0T17DRAFT_655891 [Bombardia bombarda]|uniref:Uncharacterized protein n=1 Tax=Bombardia bombarda TaxID=252184 RepID=A0AA40C1X1_9PEZI|nr:hypothetical protein B0T17DRAFT_655891 [Bombardia bombarda]